MYRLLIVDDEYHIREGLEADGGGKWSVSGSQ